MARFETRQGTYGELGGASIEALASALESPLSIAVDLYDTDSANFIDGLYKITVDLTIAFSTLIMVYYFVAIYTMMNKLRSVMIDEFNFYGFLPQIEFREPPELNLDSLDSTKEVGSS
jgi:hypothetical protein